MNNQVLDDWADKLKISRGLIFVADNYRHPVMHLAQTPPDGYRPETDAEFRKRIKNNE